MVSSARLTNVEEIALEKYHLPMSPSVGKPNQVKVKKGSQWVYQETYRPEIFTYPW